MSRMRKARRVAMVATGALALGGGAATAFVGGPESGAIPQSDGPDLVSASVTNVNFSDGDRETATYCFDTNVTDATPADYLITSYDHKRRWRAVEAQTGVAPDPQRCVLAEFEADSNLLEGTVAYVNNNAALENGNNGQESPVASVPLEGATVQALEGETTGPDLIGATADATGQRVVYCYDEVLDDEFQLTPFQFVVTSLGGGEMEAVAAAVVSPKCIRATFPDPSDGVNDADEFNVRSAARAWSAFGATQDEDDGLDGGNPNGTSAGTPSAERAVGVVNGAASSRTSRPDLVGATQVNPNQVVLEFDQDVDQYDPNEVFLITDDGERIQAQSLRRDGEQHLALASFDDVEELVGIDARGRELGEVVGVEVRSGAVFDSEVELNDKLPNTVGQADLFTPQEIAGRTNAPDLLRAVFKDRNNVITARFDEDVRDAGFNLNGIRLLRESGIEEPAIRASFVDDDRVTFEYQVSSDAGIALITRRGAVQDDNSTSAGANGVNTREFSVGQSIAIGQDPNTPCSPQPLCEGPTTVTNTVTTPVPTPGPTTTTTTTTTVTVPDGNQGSSLPPRAARTASLRTGVSFRKAAGSRIIAGKVTSETPGCRVNRVVNVTVDGKRVRGTKSGGDVLTKANGQWTVTAPSAKYKRVTISIPRVTKTLTRTVAGKAVKGRYTCGAMKKTFRVAS